MEEASRNKSSMAGRNFVSYAEAEQLSEDAFQRDPNMVDREPPALDEESEFAFIYNLFFFKDTAVEHVWPQLVLAWLMCLLSNAIYWLVKGYNVAAVDDVIDDSNDFHYQPSNAWIPIDVEAMHGIVGQILGFLIVFRSSQSYGSFVEGRKILGDIANNLRELSMNTYTFHVREELTDDAALVAELREKVRRQINLLYAVVRQQIREKQEGFEPGCLIEGKPFEENWQLDPVVPRISGLMTVDEFKTLNSLPAPMRPAWVQVQLNMNAQLLSRHLEEPGFYVQIFSRNAEDVMNLFKSAFRIVETPVPMPYRHILYVLVFGFVYVTPWIYVNNGKFWLWCAGWTSSTLTCLCYYGILELSAVLQNPFGWDSIDLDLEKFGKRVNAETKVICEAVNAQEKARDYSLAS
jgi:predicted membrane chloride channel (bestrophin family)